MQKSVPTQNGPKIGTLETSHTQHGVSVLVNVSIRQLANVLLANAGCVLIRHQRFGLCLVYA